MTAFHVPLFWSALPLPLAFLLMQGFIANINYTQAEVLSADKACSTAETVSMGTESSHKIQATDISLINFCLAISRSHKHKHTFSFCYYQMNNWNFVLYPTQESLDKPPGYHMKLHLLNFLPGHHWQTLKSFFFA